MRMYGRAVACVFLAIAIALAALDGRAQTVVRPLSVTGPYPVTCTNVEQDSVRVPAGETAEMYWRGASTGTISTSNRTAQRRRSGLRSAKRRAANALTVHLR